MIGRASTRLASRDLQQRCKHWRHKFDVDFTAEAGRVRFPGAVAILEAEADALLVTIQTEEPQQLDCLKSVLAEHLDRFAFSEAPLPFVWDAAPAAPPSPN